jgi:hypothetical protein
MTATRIKYIVLLALLTMGALIHLSCGEGSLPPSSPDHTSQLTVTGYAD